jgi:UDP:flavonoid glycosyltransferase YjiC (YdhE family)
MSFFISGISKLNYFRPVLVSHFTNGVKINMNPRQTELKPNILLAPLDWGLGHATRCIPLIRSLLRHSCQVILAGEGKGRELLSREFPDLPFLDLPGYRVRYSRTAGTLPFLLLAQIPKIVSCIQYENQRLAEWVKERRVDAVISDNRFGLSHPDIPCAFMTHQLEIRTPMKPVTRLLQQLNYRYINKFSECWVPDSSGPVNLSGELGHPKKLPGIPVHYTGTLSRFRMGEGSGKRSGLLVLLSGPEPQRTMFEEMVIDQMEDIPGSVILVRGLPGEDHQLSVPANVRVFNHLPAEELEEQMRHAEMVLARCGYSTIMDLAAMKQKSILVPTPGQTEQEYLAGHLMKHGFALCIEQHKFRLKQAMDLASGFPYHPMPGRNEAEMDLVVKGFLDKIKAGHKFQ